MYTVHQKSFLRRFGAFLFGVLAAAVLGLSGPSPAHAAVTIQVESAPISSPVPPIIVNGRTLVPIRFVAVAMGAEVEWNGTERLVTVRKDGDTLHIWLDSRTALVNQKAVLLDVPAMLVEGRTMVPIRFIAESLGYAVSWDADSATVNLTRDTPNPPAITHIVLSGTPEEPEVLIGTTRPLHPVVSTLTNPDRLVLDFPGTEVADDVASVIPGSGGLIRQIRWGYPAPGTARVVLVLSAQASFEVVPDTHGIRVKKLANPTVSINLESLPGRARITWETHLPAKDHVVLSPDRKTLTVKLPQAATVLTPGGFPFADGTMATIEPETKGSRAAFTIRLPEYLGHTFAVDGDRAVLDIVTSPLYQRRIWVDAGHGGSDVGTTGTTYGLREADVNLAVALRLQQYLEQAGALVYMTRTDSSGVSLDERVIRANKADPPIDAFISIHHNAMPGKPGVSGIETYYYTAHSEALARAIHQELVAGLGLPDRGVRTADFRVIKYTLPPAVLAELGYMTSPVDEGGMIRPDYPDRAARALLSGLMRYFRSSGAAAAFQESGSLFPGDRARVATGGDRLNLRAAPSTSAAVLAQLSDGTEVAVIGVSGDWVQVEVGSLRGFVHGDYLRK